GSFVKFESALRSCVAYLTAKTSNTSGFDMVNYLPTQAIISGRIFLSSNFPRPAFRLSAM
ncbi:MAG: hypothetical protein ACKVG9_07480, partial [Rhodospirillales bacterium]